MVTGANPLAQIFHFETKHVARALAEPPIKQGIDVTIVVEAPCRCTRLRP
ncbi:MAG: hypothetical protein GYA24_17445 [Candidatus Lokiarchaeota archaeon]|nr:hypothetical protein [Candidatus Lokiarchaeota archaeon]